MNVRVLVTQRQTDRAANGTINREPSALKRMFTLACQAGKLLAAPHIPMLQEDNVRRGFFEREQFESVHRLLPAEVQPVVTFGYLTGWRINSEVLTLQWHQVDLRAGIVRLDPGTTKNREGRSFHSRCCRSCETCSKSRGPQRRSSSVRRAGSCRGCSTATAARESSIVVHGCARASRRGFLGASHMTCVARPS